MEYIHLSTEQIVQLESQACQCDNWSLILVHPEIDLSRIQEVVLSGTCSIGNTQGTVTIGSLEFPCGIYRAHLQDVTVGNGVYIQNIGQYIAHTHIEDQVVLSGVGRMDCQTNTTCGNGVEVSALNEGGARKFPIHKGQSVHEAYLLCTHLYRESLREVLLKSVDNFVESTRTSYSHIGKGSRIENTTYLDSVYIGAYAEITGVARIENSSIESNQQARTHIGVGVILKDSIVESGALIEDYAQVERCLIGQATQMGKNYSAIDSVCFANGQFFHGEATSIFAGPYTVTHHKSTLLIGGLFSFMNAGSNSNQSNHMYKMGPIHQGILERGCKTTSGSYIMWPAHIPPFTMIMGYHSQHPNIPNFPFSYLVNQKGKSYLKPGINYAKVGTQRDLLKWSKRDLRQGDVLDQITFEGLNPHVLSRMAKGLTQLLEWRHEMNPGEEMQLEGCWIKQNDIVKGITHYTQLLNLFFAQQLLKQLDKQKDCKTWVEPPKNASEWQWIDMGGLILPNWYLEELQEKWQQKTPSIAEIKEAFEYAANQYSKWTWQWTYAVTLSSQELTILTPELISGMLRVSLRAYNELFDALKIDFCKEFGEEMMVGYGLDGCDKALLSDFDHVHGRCDAHPFIQEQEKKIQERVAQTKSWIECLTEE